MVLLQPGCLGPQFFWPQTDHPDLPRVGSKNAPVVLIASRKSEFKDALVTKLTESIVAEGMARDVIGLSKLNDVDASKYDVVILIGRVMGWQLDRNVSKYLKRQTDHGNIIIVTTSGSSQWTPKKKGRNFDAISTASRTYSVDRVASKVMAKLKLHLHKEATPK